MGIYLHARVPNATRLLSAIFGFKTMNILILGAGRVGESVAESLVSEKNNITIVDTDPSRLQDLQARLDLKVIVGNGIQPTVLAQAGAGDADMLIACAASDETNLVACKIAHERFNLPTTIARVRSPEFVENDPLTSREHGFAVDHVVCPEQIVTAYIEKLIAYPEALQVLAFAEGLLNLIAVRAVEGSPLVKHRLGEIPGLVPACELRVVAIFRNEKALMTLDGNSTIEHGDEVFVLAAAKDIHDVLVAMHNPSDPVRRLVIAGGGNVGLRLARSIAEDHRLKIIEPRKIRCDYLASQLPTRVLVLHGDASDARLLEDERIGDTDMFLALTNDDETNIMSALLAKQMGAAKVLAIVNRKAYADLVQGTQIDVALSPAHAAIGSFLTYVRRGNVVAVHSLRRGTAEALEGIVLGDRKSSPMALRRVDQIKLPKGALIGAIVRELSAESDGQRSSNTKQILMAHHDTVIKPGDHVVIFVSNKKDIHQVEKLFQVEAGYL